MGLNLAITVHWTIRFYFLPFLAIHQTVAPTVCQALCQGLLRELGLAFDL